MPQQYPERSSPGEQPAPRRPDASMSLLNNVMDHSLDEGYAEAAARRGGTGASRLPGSLRAKLGLAGGVALAALVVTLGAARAQDVAPTAAKERQKLIDRIQVDTGEVDRLQESVDRLRVEVAAKQREALDDEGADRTALVALLAGATEVTGPGVKLVVDDARGSEQSSGGGPRRNTGFSDTGRVRDRDMQRIVNGLWSSGAEAVAVNGQRLTELSAIRAAGDAILVDNKPLAPPYTVLAIGDGQRLGASFQDSADGQYLRALRENYGIRAAISAEDELRLPAATSLVVRYAEPVAGDGPANATESEKGAK